MLAGPNCKNTRDASFSEGDEPRHTCDKCRAPEPVHVNRIADRKDPELVRKSDIRPHIPDSVEEGQVVQTEVEYYSDADGGVSGVQVIKSSGNREFDRSVIGAVLQWRYSPAVQDGVPQRVKMTRKVTGKG